MQKVCKTSESHLLHVPTFTFTYSPALVSITSQVDGGIVSGALAKVREFQWTINYKTITRLCHTKSIVSVNDEFPGPTIFVNEGDIVNVKITNMVSSDITIHWHGVRQLLTAWADGPAFITQCPIQTGQSYTYKFQIIAQRGTLFWHAHISWLRATVYGAFIIRPNSIFNQLNPSLPPKNNIVEHDPIIIGEWWVSEVEDIIAQAILAGGRYNASDALTFNGNPGPLFNCSSEGILTVDVREETTHLLRIINAALNFQMYFAVANHTLTVVEHDAAYVEPFETDVVLLAPGQTMNVLLKANQPKSSYAIAASIYSPQKRIRFQPVPTSGILHYKDSTISFDVNSSSMPLPVFPAADNATFEASFNARLKGLKLAFPSPPLNGADFTPPDDVPFSVDEDLFYTVGYALQNCSDCTRTTTPGVRMGTAINNIGFVTPTSTSLLQAYFNNESGVYDTDFPDVPEVQYNYTSAGPANNMAKMATKVKVLEYGANVQIVMQDTGTLFFESHPVHLHGHNFYVVGSGFGTYDAASDPSTFNLDNPPSLNTVSVPYGGWVAIRFKATNPGVWFMHCHIEIHPSIGMAMAFIVKNGTQPNETLGAPPYDLPLCKNS